MPVTVAEVQRSIAPHLPRLLRGTGCQQATFRVKAGVMQAYLLSHGQAFVVDLVDEVLSKTGCQLASYITQEVLKKRGIA